MITILRIKFNSDKQYTYKLASGSAASPKPGDTLGLFTSASRSRAFYTSMRVVDVYQTASLPPIVSKQIRIVDKELHCVTEAVSVARASPKPTKTHKAKPTVTKTQRSLLQPIWDAMDRIFASLDIVGSDGSHIKKGTPLCQHAKKKY